MRKNKGFTLIELLVVVGIIAVLISLGSVAYTSAQASARDTRRKQDLQDLKKALYLHKTDYGTFIIGGYLACCAATTWSSPVDNSTWGATGSAPNSLYNVFVVGNKYMKAVPRDPKFTLSTQDYHVYVTSSDSFILSARLEKAPASNVGCTPTGSERNYCITD